MIRFNPVGRNVLLRSAWKVVSLISLGMAIAGLPAEAADSPADRRQVVSLDGAWQIAEGPNDKIPSRFERQIPVPGLADMARPPFLEVGREKSGQRRQAFWYRRACGCRPLSGSGEAEAS